MNKESLKRFAKPALGLGLLIVLVSQLDTQRLKAVAIEISWPWFVGALLLAVAANIVCAIRWKKVVEVLGDTLTVQQAIRLYFQGVAANTVLPGGIVGGDIWRAIGLTRHGASTMNAARTVLLDRVAGFWGLSVISLLALGATQWTDQIPAGIASNLAPVYGALLAAAAVAPLAGFALRLSRESRAIFGTAWLSFVAQLLTIAAFWCCMMAVGAAIGFTLLACVCAGVFLGAVAPASIGGFGSREVAAVFFLSVIGVLPEPGFVASFLFGLIATLQGLGFFLLVLKGRRPKA